MSKKTMKCPTCNRPGWEPPRDEAEVYFEKYDDSEFWCGHYYRKEGGGASVAGKSFWDCWERTLAYALAWQRREL
jgi:hypothetical protein